jgi:putative hydrolase of the HAD superfamily
MESNHLSNHSKVGNVKSTVAIFDLGNVVLNWHVPTVLKSLPFDNEIQQQLDQQLFSHNDWLAMDHGLLSEKAVISNIKCRSSLNDEHINQAILAAKCSLIEIERSVALMQKLVDQSIPLYCLSNMSVETYQHVKDYKFFELFEGIVISGIEKCMKPDSSIYQCIIQRYQLDPAQCLFIDDRLENVEAARENDLQAWHFFGTDNCYQSIEKAFCK